MQRWTMATSFAVLMGLSSAVLAGASQNPHDDTNQPLSDESQNPHDTVNQPGSTLPDTGSPNPNSLGRTGRYRRRRQSTTILRAASRISMTMTVSCTTGWMAGHDPRSTPASTAIILVSRYRRAKVRPRIRMPAVVIVRLLVPMWRRVPAKHRAPARPPARMRHLAAAVRPAAPARVRGFAATSIAALMLAVLVRIGSRCVQLLA